jgi:iron complex outermembrane receptor protein
VDIAGFYNEILTGVSYENYDLLRTDMMRCKNVKGFNIYHPVYGKLDKCTTVSAADSDQTLKQESYSAYAQDALYLTDKWIAVAGMRYQYYTQYAGKGRPFNVNTDSRDEQWTPKLGLVYKLTPSVSLFANYSQTFMPQSSIASYWRPAAGNVKCLRSGRKFDLFDGVTANIALFDIHKRNVLYTESIGMKPSPKPRAACVLRAWRWISPGR